MLIMRVWGRYNILRVVGRGGRDHSWFFEKGIELIGGDGGI
jgi:hypothetical protein